VDAELALKWYRRSAESGDPDAQVVLGQKYEDGEGGEQNYELAAKWFRNAAEHVPDLGGAGQGRSHLGLLYMEGRAVLRGYPGAHFWFSLNGREAMLTMLRLTCSLTRLSDRHSGKRRERTASMECKSGGCLEHSKLTLNSNSE
jgi:TPR repeat protein